MDREQLDRFFGSDSWIGDVYESRDDLYSAQNSKTTRLCSSTAEIDIAHS